MFTLSTVDLNYILLFLLAMALAVVRTCRFTAFCYPCGISTLFLYACLAPNMHNVLNRNNTVFISSKYLKNEIQSYILFNTLKSKGCVHRVWHSTVLEWLVFRFPHTTQQKNKTTTNKHTESKTKRTAQYS
jgi:hypothetical protein